MFSRFLLILPHGYLSDWFNQGLIYLIDFKQGFLNPQFLRLTLQQSVKNKCSFQGLNHICRAGTECVVKSVVAAPTCTLEGLWCTRGDMGKANWAWVGFLTSWPQLSKGDICIQRPTVVITHSSASVAKMTFLFLLQLPKKKILLLIMMNFFSDFLSCADSKMSCM